MKSHFYAFTCAGLIALSVAPARALTQEQGTLSVTTPEKRSVTVEFITDDIVRVTNAPVGVKPVSTGASVLAAAAVSGHAVAPMAGWKGFTSASGLTVAVEESHGRVMIGADNRLFVYDTGSRTTRDGKTTISLYTPESGRFYGAGERGHKLDLKGDTLVMYNRQNYGYTAGDPRISQMNITMPLFVSSAGFGVVFDDHDAATMVMKDPITYTTESNNPVSYYFVDGAGSVEGVARRMSALTGRQKLPPFWSLGYITSKYGYHNQSETLGVVDTLKRAGYPVDGIVLDLYWYGKEQDMGRLAWDPEQWPAHRSMLRKLKKQGVNTVIISQPYILRNGRGLDNYNELKVGNLMVMDSVFSGPQEVKIWVGEGGMFDVSNPETVKWLRNRYRQLTDEGVTGWWGDLGEPEVHPESGRHANGMTARQYHNKYGNDWSKIISDLFEEEYPDTRLMTMMRGGTTGLQRYSVFPWSTDVSRSWGGLQPQVTIMLNSGLSGLGYMSHDVGGFAIDKEHPYDPELYVRWLQLGTFSPILRTHSQETAEPFKYPDHQDIIKPLIGARYEWLPYNYTLAWENASQGLPLVRPIDFYGDGKTSEDEYLWGRDVMIAPVLTRGAISRQVTMPAEGVWLDMANPEKSYGAGETITYDAPLNVLPMFVRAGAFIPRADYKMRNTGDYRTDRYTVDYYPVKGLASSYTMYEDDRESAGSLAEGKYQLITFKGDDADGDIRITVSAEGTYDGAPKSKRLTFNLMNVDKPASVTVGDKKLKGWKYDAQKRRLTLTTDWATARQLNIDVAL